jgi:hypothetical protein
MSNLYTIAKKCKLAKGFLPSFTPTVYYLSVNTSPAGAYSNVTITGNNFLPNGTTYVNFGTDYTNIPISYYGSNHISFLVPTNAISGSYEIIVVNNYTSNFGSHINNFYNSNLNYSNSVTYTLT